MTRRNFPAKVKVAAFQRCGGLCEECSAKLGPGNVEYDHRVPDAMGGEPTLENAVVLCRSCHRLKTEQQDVPAIAKAKRRERKHIGAHRPKAVIPGSKASGWKRKLNGEVVRR